MIATYEQIQAALEQTRKARDSVRKTYTTDVIIAALSQTAKRWLDPAYTWRQMALDRTPGPTGFSREMIAEIIDLIFGSLTAEALGEMVDRELGHRRALDQLCQQKRGLTRATGLSQITHILAGNIPAPGILSICCGLLLKSANLVKCSTHDPEFPVLFVESLREVDAALADCVVVLNWPREELPLTHAALAETDAVIAFGDDQSIDELRKLARPESLFLGYGHKLSFGIVMQEAMTATNLPALAAAAAFDASVYDQQGCLSPHLFYVEERGEIGPRQFAVALAKAMEEYHLRVPRGPMTTEETAAIATTRSGYEFRAATDKRVQVLANAGTNDWLVIYEDDPYFTVSCLNRVVYVKPIDSLPRVLAAIQRMKGRISNVGISPMNERALAFTAELANLGVHRVCPIGQMQRPPLWWYHDGRPNLADLVRWTDVG